MKPLTTQMFRFQSITAQSNSSYSDTDWSVNVTVTIDAKYWSKMRKTGQLGMLYGVDISNAVSRINQNIHATSPTVSDHNRASKGIKKITLIYKVISAEQAEALGLKVIRLKNGVVMSKYADYLIINIPEHSEPPKLVNGQETL